MKKLFVLSFLLSLCIGVNAQIQVGDIGYSTDGLSYGTDRIDSIIVVPMEQDRKLWVTVKGYFLHPPLSYSIPYSIEEEYRQIIDNHFVRGTRGYGSSVKTDLALHILNNYTDNHWIYAKAFYKRGRKVKSKYIRFAMYQFNETKLRTRLNELNGVIDADVFNMLIDEFYVIINEIGLDHIRFRFPILTTRIKNRKTEYERLNNEIINKKLEASRQKEKTEDYRRIEMKEKLLDLISEGDTIIRNAIVTYSPVKGMSLEQIEYMNEINEAVPLKYDKFNSENGTGFVYYIKGASGSDYINTRMIFYYFRDNKFIDVYRDLVSVEKVHGKFIVK